VQPFSINACSQAVLTRALTNLVIARTRLMHRNKYDTNYAPNVPYVKNATP